MKCRKLTHSFCVYITYPPSLQEYLWQKPVQSKFHSRRLLISIFSFLCYYLSPKNGQSDSLLLKHKTFIKLPSFCTNTALIFSLLFPNQLLKLVTSQLFQESGKPDVKSTLSKSLASMIYRETKEYSLLIIVFHCLVKYSPNIKQLLTKI